MKRVLYSWTLSWTIARFLGRLLFFLSEFFFLCRKLGLFLVYFLLFFYKFPALEEEEEDNLSSKLLQCTIYVTVYPPPHFPLDTGRGLVAP